MKRVVAVFCLMFIASAAYASGRLVPQGVPGQWWSPMWIARWGGIIGGGFGTLGGIMGGLAGMLSAWGKARGLVLGMWAGFVVISVVSLIAGVTALVVKQPFLVYYPLLLIGSIGTTVGASLLPQLRRSYDRAELRRMEAQDVAGTHCQ